MAGTPVAMMSDRKNMVVIVATTDRNWLCATASVDSSVAAAGLTFADRPHARAVKYKAPPAASAKEAVTTCSTHVRREWHSAGVRK